MKIKKISIQLATLLMLVVSAQAISPVPATLNYQGRVTADGINVDGNGLFKFALVNEDGSQTYWSNDGTDGEPEDSISLNITKGLYSVKLGDQGIMTEISPDLFANNPDAHLRIWFNDGSNGFQLLTPDQPLTSVGYAMTSATVPEHSIGSDQLATNLTITGNMQASTFSGSFTGSGEGLTGIPGTFQWQETAATSISGLPNQGYVVTASELSTIYLPTTSLNIGDTFRVSGVGLGGWQIIQSGGNKILTSTIGDTPGINWVNRDSIREWKAIASSADGTKLAAVVDGGQIYTSTDSGAMWTPRDSSRAWFSIASSADGTKLAAVVDGGLIYTSTDSGATWTPRDASRSWRSIASSSDGTKLAAVVYGGQIYTSTDSGVNWTPRDASRTWYSVASSADGTKLAAVDFGGQIYTSTDSGVTWIFRESTTTGILSIASSANGNKLAALVYGGKIYTSTDSGITWTPRDSIRNWYSIASSADGSKLAAVVYGGGIYTSIDSGVNWIPRDIRQDNWYSVASSADGTKLAAVIRTGHIYTSTISMMDTLSGSQGTALELQYIGNNTWMPISFIGPFAFN